MNQNSIFKEQWLLLRDGDDTIFQCLIAIRQRILISVKLSKRKQETEKSSVY